MGSRAARLSELGGDWWRERGIASRNLSGPATAVLPRKDRGARGGGEGWRNLGTPYRFPDLQPRLQASERPGAPTPAQPAPRRDLTARQTCVRWLKGTFATRSSRCIQSFTHILVGRSARRIPAFWADSARASAQIVATRSTPASPRSSAYLEACYSDRHDAESSKHQHQQTV